MHITYRSNGESVWQPISLVVDIDIDKGRLRGEGERSGSTAAGALEEREKERLREELKRLRLDWETESPVVWTVPYSLLLLTVSWNMTVA